ncbi:MAG: hypothetical protein ACPGOY_00105 [Rhodospirillaceae bacterium]
MAALSFRVTADQLRELVESAKLHARVAASYTAQAAVLAASQKPKEAARLFDEARVFDEHSERLFTIAEEVANRELPDQSGCGG